MQLLRIILILVIIYYVARFFIRVIFPFLFQRYVNKRTGNSSGKQHYSKPKNRREGEVTIDYINKKEKKFSKDKGEYIDFKEVE